jgi:hypothetical protein
VDATPPLTGHSRSGSVRFEIVEPPLRVGYCHCTRCQRRSGTAASLNAHLVPGSLHVLAGEELLQAYQPPDGSPKVFCSACGGALWSTDADRNPVGVRLGVLDRDPGVPASYRQYVAYAAPWEPIPDDGLPRFPERRTS